jgi:hypothetical protein
MTSDDVFDLPPAWRAATNTIKDLIDGGESLITARPLPEGPGSKIGLERYAREYVKVHPTSDLAIIYNILGVSTCIAAQGAYVLQAPIADGGWLKIPAILMALGVAPSGWGKSTALAVGTEPLREALSAGIAQRRALLPTLKNAALQQFTDNNPDPTLVPDDKQFKEVYDAGLCPKTLTQDPTQEALRNQVVNNGGHGGCLAGEPDIFRNVGAYSKDAGSLSLFLNGWDQGDIDTTRVSNTDLTIEHASISMCVLFQTEVFSEVTSGNAHGMGSGADSFVARGMFGRFWVVETDKTGDFIAVARSYADDNDFDHDHFDMNGYLTADGQPTDLGISAMDYVQNLRELVLDSNPYRVAKAIRRAWEMASTKYGTDLQVPEPEQAEREIIRLDAAGRLAYRRLQRMMSEIQDHIQAADDDDNRLLWNPLATRVTQHVLREALIVALAAGKKEVTAEFIEDAATRILPWRWCLSANALTRRANERAEDIMADAVISYNPAQQDLSPAAMISKILVGLAGEHPELKSTGMPISKLRDLVRRRLPRHTRNSVGTLLKTSLQELTSDPTSGIEKRPGAKNAVGQASDYYVVKTTARL